MVKSAFLTSALDGGEWSASHPTCSNPLPLIHTRQEAVWAPELVWILWQREKILATTGNQIPAVQPTTYSVLMWLN